MEEAYGSVEEYEKQEGEPGDCLATVVFAAACHLLVLVLVAPVAVSGPVPAAGPRWTAQNLPDQCFLQARTRFGMTSSARCAR